MKPPLDGCRWKLILKVLDCYDVVLVAAVFIFRLSVWQREGYTGSSEQMLQTWDAGHAVTLSSVQMHHFQIHKSKGRQTYVLPNCSNLPASLTFAALFVWLRPPCRATLGF